MTMTRDDDDIDDGVDGDGDLKIKRRQIKSTVASSRILELQWLSTFRHRCCCGTAMWYRCQTNLVKAHTLQWCLGTTELRWARVPSKSLEIARNCLAPRARFGAWCGSFDQLCCGPPSRCFCCKRGVPLLVKLVTWLGVANSLDFAFWKLWGTYKDALGVAGHALLIARGMEMVWHPECPSRIMFTVPSFRTKASITNIDINW